MTEDLILDALADAHCQIFELIELIECRDREIADLERAFKEAQVIRDRQIYTEDE